MFLQDHARAFAGSQSDEHKYELYMKATGFEAIMQKQNASEAHIQQVKGDLNGWSDRLEVGVAQVLAPQDVGLPVFRIIMRDTTACSICKGACCAGKEGGG